MSNRIDVGPLQAAFLKSGLAPAEVCRRLEWYYEKTGKPDTTRLQRALGLMPVMSDGRHQCAQRIGIDRAALIADALNVDPFEVGL